MSDATTIRLWYWEENHAPGATAEDARRWLAEQSGERVEDCGDLDEWSEVPDDELMRDEDGSLLMPAESAVEYARKMAAPAPTFGEEAPVSAESDASGKRRGGGR